MAEVFVTLCGNGRRGIAVATTKVDATRQARDMMVNSILNAVDDADSKGIGVAHQGITIFKTTVNQ